jgi:beta-galactosidase
MLDWRTFWFDNIRQWLDDRSAVVGEARGAQSITTHVALSGFTGQLATHTLDEWALAGTVDGFGVSSFPTWLMEDDPVEHLFNLDAARAAAAGKPFLADGVARWTWATGRDQKHATSASSCIRARNVERPGGRR